MIYTFVSLIVLVVHKEKKCKSTKMKQFHWTEKRFGVNKLTPTHLHRKRCTLKNINCTEKGFRLID